MSIMQLTDRKAAYEAALAVIAYVECTGPSYRELTDALRADYDTAWRYVNEYRGVFGVEDDVPF
jgi:hypothetical protein